MGKRQQILLVEDHADTAEMMARLLLSEGYVVTVAKSCKEALAKASGSVFDLFLLDVGLPDGDGCDLLGQLLEHTPAKAIAMTAYSMPKDLEKLSSVGFASHLIKPVKFSDVSATIKRVLVQTDAR